MATLGLIDEYLPATLEAAWQQAWRERGYFDLSEEEFHRDPEQVLVTAPGTCSPLQISEIRGYVIADAYARYRRASGRAVLFSVGLEDFDPSTELKAVEQEESPRALVAEHKHRVSGQLERLGISFDASRRYNTSEPTFCRVSQQLFLLLLESGLLYRADGPLDWCERCERALAGIQIDDGRCQICATPVSRVERSRWYLRSDVYRDENERRLEELERWNALGVQTQRDVLGRIEGTELDLASLDGRKLTVFTPHTDAIKQAEFVAISPRHPEIERWIDLQELRQRLADGAESRPEQPPGETTAGPLVDTGHVLIGANTSSPLPVYVTASIEDRFGATAVLAIPAVDRLDEQLARGISTTTQMAWRVKDDRPAKLRAAVRYRLRDIPISRPGTWGVSIPVIHCEVCGSVAVAGENLPVSLPEEGSTAGSPSVSCPRCGQQARRESDILDCDFNRLWEWVAVSVQSGDRAGSLFEDERLRDWRGAGRAIFGVQHARAVFDQRAIAKLLRDRGLLANLTTGEPYHGASAHQRIDLPSEPPDGVRHGAPDVDSLLSEQGADAVRLSVLYAAAPTTEFAWGDNALIYCGRWLKKLWEFALPRLSALESLGIEPLFAENDKLHLRLKRWCQIARTRTTENLEDLDMHKAVRNVMRLLQRIEAFERLALTRGVTPEDQAAIAAALLLLLALLSPLAPHISEELWSRTRRGDHLTQSQWPVDSDSESQLDESKAT